MASARNRAVLVRNRTTHLLGLLPHTNSFGGSTTMLYGIDNTTGSLYIQNPPNNGSQTLVGSLGVSGAIGPNVGFNIGYPSNTAYATFQSGTADFGLYNVNLGTGAASLLASLGSQNITSLAVSSVPEPATLVTLGTAFAGFAAFRWRRKETKLS